MCHRKKVPVPKRGIWGKRSKPKLEPSGGLNGFRLKRNMHRFTDQPFLSIINLKFDQPSESSRVRMRIQSVYFRESNEPSSLGSFPGGSSRRNPGVPFRGESSLARRRSRAPLCRPREPPSAAVAARRLKRCYSGFYNTHPSHTQTLLPRTSSLFPHHSSRVKKSSSLRLSSSLPGVCSTPMASTSALPLARSSAS